MDVNLRERRRAREESVNMQARLSLYWLSLLAAVFAAALVLLSMTGVLPGTKQKVGELLAMRQRTLVSSAEQRADLLMSRSIQLSEETTGVLSRVLSSEGRTFEQLNDDPKLIARLETGLFPIVKSVLDANICSGAFVALDATVNTSAPNAGTSRMGVCLRLTELQSSGSGSRFVRYYRGAKEVARSERMELHNRWELEFDVSALPGYDFVFRTTGRPAENCCWTEAVPVRGTWEKAMLLCVPVQDAAGRTRGVCGLDVTNLYFQLSAPATDSPAGCIVTAAAPLEGDRLLLDRALLGDTEGTYLTPEGRLKVGEGKYFNTYTAEDGSVYIGRHTVLPVRMLGGRPLAAVSLLPRGQYRQYAGAANLGWTFGTLGIFLLTLVLCILLSHHFMKPIHRSLKSIRPDSAPDELHSGISEIDELYALLLENKSRLSGDLPSNVMELLDEFEKKVGELTPTERMVFRFYIEGYSFEEIAQKSYISVNTIRKHNTSINRKLGTTSHEELLLYIDLFRRCGQLGRISK